MLHKYSSNSVGNLLVNFAQISAQETFSFPIKTQVALEVKYN